MASDAEGVMMDLLEIALSSLMFDFFLIFNRTS